MQQKTSKGYHIKSDIIQTHSYPKSINIIYAIKF
jgi:hypothetical protein